MARGGRIALVVLCLGGLLGVTWEMVPLPPPRLALTHGLPPAGGPTGRVRDLGGLRFVETGPGYCHVKRHVYVAKGDFFGWICGPLGLPFGEPPERHPEFVDRWIEVPRPFWISLFRIPQDGSGDVPPAFAERLAAYPDVLCCWLRERAGGEFRRATRWEIYTAAVQGALPVSGKGCEWLVGEDGEVKVLLTGPEWGKGSWSGGDLPKVGGATTVLTRLSRREKVERTVPCTPPFRLGPLPREGPYEMSYRVVWHPPDGEE